MENNNNSNMNQSDDEFRIEYHFHTIPPQENFLAVFKSEKGKEKV